MTNESEPSTTVSTPSPELGRAWLGPGLLLAGVLALGRAEVLERLAILERGVDPNLAAWSVLGEWQAILIQALIMGCVTTVVIWSVGARHRVGALLFGTVLGLSALTGWPVAPDSEVPAVGGSSPLGPYALFVVAFGGALAAVVLAGLARKSSGFERALGSNALLIPLGLIGLGGPGYLMWSAATNAPTMPVREIVREVLTKKDDWKVAQGLSEHPPEKGVLGPVAAPRFTKTQFDTGDKPSLLMPPPCEVTFEILESDGPCTLRAAAQLSATYTDRGYVQIKRHRKESVLDKRNLDSVAVRFEVLLNDESVLDEVVRHTHEDTGLVREWRHVGGTDGLAVQPGDKITLRTSLGDEGTVAAFANERVDCGFGDLVLERSAPVERRRATPDKPNILYIVMDTLRADRMSCYGYPKLTTPNVDSLASRGLLFENAYATSSWTWPSTASLLTGLLPYEHGVLSRASCNLSYSCETLAEVLQARGYTTEAISCNPLIDPTRFFDQGFEHFDSSHEMRMTDEVIERVEAALENLAGTRFFLYLQLVDPHTPHHPLESELERLGGEAPEDYPDSDEDGVYKDGLDAYAGILNRHKGPDTDDRAFAERKIPESHRRWLSDRYDASVGTGDVYVGRILSHLRALGLEENTIVVFTSDHGEELLDHGTLAHGHAVWRELVRVPMILAGPGIPSGKRISTEMANRHLAPTLAMIGGGELADVADAKNLLDPDPLFSKIFYQTSKGMWNGHHNLEVLGWRDDEYVTHHAEQGAPCKEEPPHGGTRLFDTVDDSHEEYDVFLNPPAGRATRA